MEENLENNRILESGHILEYEELGKNLRYYSSFRLAQFTIFAFLTGGLLFFLYGNPTPFSIPKQIILKLLGMMIAIAFFLMEERASDCWNQFRQRAIELEGIFGFRQYRGEPEKLLYNSFPYNKMSLRMRNLLSTRFTVNRATRWIYRLVIIFWIFTMVSP